MPSPTDEVKTSDLYLTAFLLCQGETLLNVQEGSVQGKRRVTFYFPATAKAQIQAFYNGAECSALGLKTHIDRCKSLIYDVEGGF